MEASNPQNDQTGWPTHQPDLSRHHQLILLQFRENQWIDNRWPSIDIEPMDQSLFFRLLDYLSVTYNFPMPRIIDTIDGHAADIEILGSAASLSIDAYLVSLGFQQAEVRDQVLSALMALPENYFDESEHQDF